MKKSRKIIDVFFINVLITFIIATFLIGYSDIYQSYNRYKKERENYKKNYLDSKKATIKSLTERSIEYIDLQIEEAEHNLQIELKNRVYEAHSIATHIYNINKGKESIGQIKELIKEALRPIRFNNGRGYYFIGSLDGYDILFPIAPEMEGKYLYNMQDKMGNYVMQDELSVVNSTGEGYAYGYWEKPDSEDGRSYKKMSFIKLFEPLGWYLGTGEYVSDYDQQIQNNVIKVLSKVRFEKEGYVFVNTFDGDALILDGEIVEEKLNLWDLEDVQGVKVIQEERQASKQPGGDFIYYHWKRLNSDAISPKISFVKGVPEWRWMVGAGIYYDDVEEEIKTGLSGTRSKIRRDIFFILIILVVEIVVITLFFTFLSRRVKYGIRKIDESFDVAATSRTSIDEDKFIFAEFKSMASTANKLLSALNEVETEKKHDEAFFERLFDISPQAIALFDEKDELIKINEHFESLFGFTPGEIRKSHLDQLIVPPELYKEAVLQTQKLQRGIEISYESIRVTKVGKKIPVLIQAIPVFRDKAKIGIYIIYHDISVQKENERILLDAKNKAEESDRLKSAFLANMSHEIRTPMNAILGFSSLLGSDLSEEDRTMYLSIIRDSSNSLLRLIDDIIDLSVIEAQNFKVNYSTFDLIKILEDLKSTYQSIIDAKEQKNLKIELQIPEKTKTLPARSDPARLQQVLSNLLDNAVKFTHEGQINFGFTIEESKIRFYVQDTGIGISKEQLTLIFDRFRQADGSATRKYSGTGLGLAISKRIIELLDGQIWVESELNKGSKFEFEIPNEEIPRKSKLSKLLADFETIDWASKNILIAEDVPTNFKFLESALKITKANILWAKNGEDVLELAQRNNVDLILMDIQMPKMNGHKALQALRKKKIEVPVIAQTAYALEQDIKEILRLGYDDYLIKPVNIKALFEKSSRFLS